MKLNAVAVCAMLVAWPVASAAQAPPANDGPPAPVPPQVQARDEQGRSTIRAVRLDQPLRIDGQLDEPLYRTVDPVGGFIQLEPQAGAPATERTDIWIAFDDANVYVTVRCWDSQPEDRWILTEMRRDSLNIGVNENVAFWFDTFYDRQNAFEFEINPIGGIYDSQIINGRFNADWNPVWERQVGRFEGGWTAEMAVPFKSLRYGAGSEQVWGFNMRRTIRWKNEETFLTRVPRRGGANARGSIALVNSGATLVGLSAPPGSRNLEVKPYALSSLNTDRIAVPTVRNDVDGDFGFDVKYGVTQNLTADFTYRTDFAQVEVDAQQVNLTRFSLFYPEKRDFFLEGQGIFDFGGAGATAAGVTPLLFFSRRIGLNEGRTLPIDVGGRLTGRVGRFTLGVLNVATGEDDVTGTARTNFSVLRVRRDILRRSTIGAMFTNRSVATLAPGAAQTYGIDTTLGFGATLNIDAYLARTKTPGIAGNDTSARAHLNYNGGQYGLELDHLRVGDNFNPDVGFLRRDDFRRSFASGRYSPRIQSLPSVRRLIVDGSLDYFEDGQGRPETRTAGVGFGLEFDNNDTLDLQYTNYYELLKAPFGIAPGVRLPSGGYEFRDIQASYTLQNTHMLAGTASLAHGSFYNGQKTTAGFSGGRMNVTPRISLEPGASINWVVLDEGSFTSAVFSLRTTFTATPLMFVSGYLQHNSANDVMSTNLRFRWEYRPGSEFFVVYTDERDSRVRGFPGLRNRAFVMKINRLLRF